MNTATLSAGYLRARPLQTALSLLLLSLGVATIVLLLLVVNQLEERMHQDAAGIDLVAGAVIGLLLGHVLASVLGAWLRARHHAPITGLDWRPEEFWLVAIALAVGV